MRTTWIVCVVLCCLVGGTARAEMLQHLGNTDPATEGWYVMSGVPGYAEADYWVTKTNGYGRWAPTGTAWQSYFADDWSLTVEARWVAGPLTESRATIFDGTHAKSTAFTWDSTNAYYYQAGLGDTAMPGVDPTVFNTYELQYRGDDLECDVLANGNIVTTLDDWTMNDITPGQYLLYWGDNSGLGPSEMHWREVTFRDYIPAAIPEPSTLVLLLGAAIAFFAFRKRW